jgi:glycerol-3-phosphate dehydrogenase
VIVNASGPWTDLTAGALGKPSSLMGGTKGSHVVLDNPELLAATGGREIFFEHQDGRIVLVYPLKGRVLVGTTDLEADPGERAVCTEEEVDYFFELVGQVFPDVRVDRSQIVYRFSGIRPLPRHDDMVPGFVSRDYRIVDSQGPGAPMLNLVGGKWTTFRALGEQLADRVLALLQRERSASTEDVSIGGGRNYPRPEAKDAWIRSELGGVSLERGRILLERYGTRAREVVNFLADAHDEPILGDRLSSREVAYFVEHEKATRLNDVLLRRTDVTYTGDLTSDVFEHTLAAFADAAGWDASRVEEERSLSLDDLQAAHGVSPRVAPERAGQRRRTAR